jgi:hypothetical protein
MVDIKPIDGGAGLGEGSPRTFGVTSETTVFEHGVLGSNTAYTGVTGLSEAGVGVVGSSRTGPGVLGQANGVAPGILALAAPAALGGSEALAQRVEGLHPIAPFSSLVSAHPGLAALLAGKVLITDLLSGDAAAFLGKLKAASASFVAEVVAASARFSGAVDAASGAFTGEVSAAKVHGSDGGKESAPKHGYGVWGDSDSGYGVYGSSKSGSAGWFAGNITVTGDIEVEGDVLLKGADCAEQFALGGSAAVEPGTVLVIDDDGALCESNSAYDRRVAGVVSGAGSLRPGIVLDRQPEREDRVTVALVGKAYCKVDADSGEIGVGDLLTTSATPGHAMRVSDGARGFGAVIGKALRPLASGKGMVPILIALQ